MSDLLVRHGPKLAVGGLVLLNLVLIGALVLRDPVRTAVPAEPVPASSPSVTASPTSTSTGSATETTTSAATSLSPGAAPSEPPSTMPSPSPLKVQPNGNARSRPRLLAANSGRVAWRAESTGCKGTAVVEVTTNGGRSWSRTKPGLTAIVRLKAYRDDSVFAIGADSKCRPTYAWITGPSGTWQRDQSQVKDLWYRNPDDLDEVHAPGGRNSKPCGDALSSLAGLGTSQAAALCSDGRIRTNRKDRSWKTVQPRSGALDLNADDNWFVAVGTRSGCSGVVVRRFDANGSGLSDKGNCQSKVTPTINATVVSVQDRRVWLWSGDDTITY